MKTKLSPEMQAEQERHDRMHPGLTCRTCPRAELAQARLEEMNQKLARKRGWKFWRWFR